jgi:hypothetical protein
MFGVPGLVGLKRYKERVWEEAGFATYCKKKKEKI